MDMRPITVRLRELEYRRVWKPPTRIEALPEGRRLQEISRPSGYGTSTHAKRAEDSPTLPLAPERDMLTKILAWHCRAYQHETMTLRTARMAKAIGISASTLSRIKAGTMPDAIGFARIVVWLALAPERDK